MIQGGIIKMKTVQISLNSIDKVKSFVNEITKYDNDFDLVFFPNRSTLTSTLTAMLMTFLQLWTLTSSNN